MTTRYRGWMLGYIIGILALIIAVHFEWPWLLAGAPAWSGAGTGPRAIAVRVVLGDAPTAVQGQQLLLFYRPAGAWRWRHRSVFLSQTARHQSYQMDGDRLRIDYELSTTSRDRMLVFFPTDNSAQHPTN